MQEINTYIVFHRHLGLDDWFLLIYSSHVGYSVKNIDIKFNQNPMLN